MRQLRAGYTYDDAAKRQANAAGSYYWWAYIEEILDRLGLNADRISPEDLPQRLDGLSLLLLGGCGSLPALDLRNWVESGGVLIANNCDSVDDLAGNRFAKSVPQTGGDFSIAGELTLNDTDFSSGIMPPEHPNAPLLAASAMRLVDAVESTVVAKSGGHAAITARQVGQGWVFCFGFDLAQTFWVIQQGRPIDRDHDGDGYLRVPDAIVTTQYEPEVAYTDSLLLVLQNMVSVRPFPLIHRLPASGDSIPDALLFYGGDDEGSVGIQLPAARFMAEHGLPYHINCMARTDGQGFGITAEEIAELDELGTDLSLHYNFIDSFQHPSGFTKEDVDSQTRQFVEHFGRYPVSSVSHWCRWIGSADPAIWMKDAGVAGDGSWFSGPQLSLNPVNHFGFHFGTTYPFKFWTDPASGNARVDFIELPNTAYEMGYLKDDTDFVSLERALRAAVHYESTMCFFYHPIYIATFPSCRKAIVRLLELIRELGLTIAHYSPDALTKWWQARGSVTITNVESDKSGVRFNVSAPQEGSFIVNVPIEDNQAVDTSLPHEVVERFGHRWLMMVVPGGESSVEVSFCPP